MIVNSAKFGQGSGGCKPWYGYCNPNTDIQPIPYGAPGWAEDVIGAAAWTLTSIFGKYQQPQRVGYGIEPYMPIILLGGAAVLLISIVKR